MGGVSESSTASVDLGGFTWWLVLHDARAVAPALATLGMDPVSVTPSALAGALSRLPLTDRAPAWETAVRTWRFHRTLARVAHELGIDLAHARELQGRLVAELHQAMAGG